MTTPGYDGPEGTEWPGGTARREPETPENTPHDWEPSSPPVYHGGYTDPLCRVCGQPKPMRVHR